MASNTGTENYTLDALGAPWAQLTNVSYPNGDTAAYSYDANGNRLTQTFNGVTTNYSYDDAGQLLTDGTTTYSYDANGNLTNAGSDTFTWDWANRLTGATVGGNNASYSYDAFDIRVSGIVSGTTSSYLWDRLAPYPTLVDDGSYGYIHAAGPQAQIDSGGNRTYLLGDALSSIRGLTDGSGTLVGSVEYGAFGGIRAQSGATSAFGYTGEQYTPVTGLLHLRARDLNPALGRFLSVDTVRPNAPGSQGFNGYAYVANNPTSWVDPSGHFVGGYAGTIALMPTAALGAITAMSITAVLALARNPASWRFPENSRTSGIVFLTFAVILTCAVTPGCMGAMADSSGTIADNGSDSPFGLVPWTPMTLPDAPNTFPELPDIDMPPWVVAPWTVAPWTVGSGDDGNPEPGGPNWQGMGALLAALIAAIVATSLSRPPAPGNPAPQPAPAPQPIPTPVGTPVPSPDESRPKFLFHYTSTRGLDGIRQTQMLLPSTGPQNSRYGKGQYFTDISNIEAESGTAGQLSYALFKSPIYTHRVSHFVAVNVQGLPINYAAPAYGSRYGAKSFYVHPSDFPLPIIL